MVLFIFASTLTVKAAPSISLGGPSTVNVGDSVTITINHDDNHSFTGELIVSGAASGSIKNFASGPGAQMSITVKANKAGTINAQFTGKAADFYNFTPINVSASKTIKVVQKPSSSGGSSTNNSSIPSRTPDMTPHAPEAPKKETEAEIKARELEARKKVPLIKNVKVSSESNRLKGEVVSELNTEGSKFDYNFTLPRGVDAFKLDLTPLNDKVKLDYKQMYKLDAGHDKVDIIVKATDGEISQEFKFQVKKSAESKVAYSFGDKKYTLFNDEILNRNLKEYGFEYKKIENAKDAFDHYFEFNGNRFVLVVDDENNAKWLMIDEKKNVIDEVFIVSDKDKNVTVLVNEMLNEEDDRTYGGNRYEKLEVSLAKDFTDFGFDFVFNNEVYGWINDDNSLFTHAVLKKNNRRLVYLDHDGKSEVAYVAFDRNFDSPYLYGLIGFGILMTVGFISSLVVIRKRNKQINHLLNRRSAITVEEVQ